MRAPGRSMVRVTGAPVVAHTLSPPPPPFRTHYLCLLILTPEYSFAKASTEPNLGDSSSGPRPAPSIRRSVTRISTLPRAARSTLPLFLGERRPKLAYPILPHSLATSPAHKECYL